MNFRRGQRVRVRINGSYRHFLDGLEGEIVAVYYHGAAVALESPPAVLQKVIAPVGQAGPAVPNTPVYVFQFSELEQVSE